MADVILVPNGTSTTSGHCGANVHDLGSADVDPGWLPGDQPEVDQHHFVQRMNNTLDERATTPGPMVAVIDMEIEDLEQHQPVTIPWICRDNGWSTTAFVDTPLEEQTLSGSALSNNSTERCSWSPTPARIAIPAMGNSHLCTP
ncbi:hypothetical protein DM01DRAFT_1347505 [Hesseltinella vesiculosa]|uniref:Uncharacterized protein n=1 Tax=Hesseltinella vesiculosa TaxID=101127 RepID=A0A1X2GBW1_9FUNG|nr:hypothetical protein DM01DRAFT_1347505 [Hesseltinella vesiculosa]